MLYSFKEYACIYCIPPSLLLYKLLCYIPLKNKLGDTPLHNAAWKGHPEIVEMLLERGNFWSGGGEGKGNWCGMGGIGKGNWCGMGGVGKGN